MAKRLDMLASNLGTMLAYARYGAGSNDPVKRDEAIGQLRSLSGGLDDIVEETQWKGSKILDGRAIDLGLTANGGNSRRLQISNYHTGLEGGLELTNQPASGKAAVFYDYYSIFRNQTAGVSGLNITESLASPVASDRNELNTDTYRLEIEYAGPDSSVSIKTLTGGLVNKVSGVDLSGNGQELVDLGVGVTLSIEKKQFMESIDKYDYETNGPAKLYALMDYERVFRHELTDSDFNQYSDRNLDLLYRKRLTDGSGGSVSFDEIEMSGVSPGGVGFASGDYRLNVFYRGENSSVEVRDARGNMVFLNHKVDLSGSDPVKIDTGKGMKFTLKNQSFSGESGRLMAMVRYQAEGNQNADFDFRSYGSRIEKAIVKLGQDMALVADLQQNILQINSFQQSGAGGSSSRVSTAAQVGALIASSSGGDAASIFNAASATQALGAVANEVFGNTSLAVRAQGDRLAARLSRTVSA
jgi:hypothetical protein